MWGPARGGHPVPSHQPASLLADRRHASAALPSTASVRGRGRGHRPSPPGPPPGLTLASHAGSGPPVPSSLAGRGEKRLRWARPPASSGLQRFVSQGTEEEASGGFTRVLGRTASFQSSFFLRGFTLNTQPCPLLCFLRVPALGPGTAEPDSPSTLGLWSLAGWRGAGSGQGLEPRHPLLLSP